MPIQDFALLDLLFSGRGVVLDSARAEVIFFTVADMGLLCGFVLDTGLII